MFRKTTLMAMVMLGLGTLLGYAAARGHLPIPTGGASADVPAQATPLQGVKGQALPERGPGFTTAAVGGKGTPKPGNPRGSTTGPTDAPGYDHSNQFLHVKATQIAKNMEPVIVHASQRKEAIAKLAAALKKHGKKPNILVFLLDEEQEKSALPFQPLWLLVAGIVLTLAAVLIWTFALT